ncbi:MAG: hypothetical protein HY291_04435 [Planctomycetes bacterium]|nr:hypothetical protein [Planctomycetota bacterium]
MTSQENPPFQRPGIQFGYFHLLFLVVALSAGLWSIVAEQQDEPLINLVVFKDGDEATRSELVKVCPRARMTSRTREDGVVECFLGVPSSEVRKAKTALKTLADADRIRIRWLQEIP